MKTRTFSWVAAVLIGLVGSLGHMTELQALPKAGGDGGGQCVYCDCSLLVVSKVVVCQCPSAWLNGTADCNITTYWPAGTQSCAGAGQPCGVVWGGGGGGIFIP